MIGILKEAGADMNAQTRRFKETPLHFAGKVKSEMTIGFLLKLGAKWYVKNYEGLTFYELMKEQ